jgi:hypothetical protein
MYVCNVSSEISSTVPRFTTIRDVGNDANFAAVDLRKAIDAGWFVGPTVQTAGKIIAPFGSQSEAVPQEVGPLWRFEYYDADGPEEIRKAVRENMWARSVAISASVGVEAERSNCVT